MKFLLTFIVAFVPIMCLAEPATQGSGARTPDTAYADFASALATGDGAKLRASMHAAEPEDQKSIDWLAKWLGACKRLFVAADKFLGKESADAIADGLPIPSPMRWGQELLAELKRKKAVQGPDKATIDVTIGSGMLVKIDGVWKVSTRTADGDNPLGNGGLAMSSLAIDRADQVAGAIERGEIKSVAEAIAAYNK